MSPDPQVLFLRDPDLALLSPAEQERREGFASPVRRAQFALGRTALRRLCGQVLRLPPAEVPLVVRPDGAPALEGIPLFLSLSHSGDGALAAAAPHPVGCDLEAPPARPRDVLALARRFFPPGEAGPLAALEEPERTRAFLAMWTRKEAVFKTGRLDWPAAVGGAWQDGAQPLPGGGVLFLCEPPGIPAGWCARLARVLPA